MSYRSSTADGAADLDGLSRVARIPAASASNITRVDFTRCPPARRGYRVLVAHDLTAASDIAFLRAARLAHERNGELILLHVVDDALPAPVREARRACGRSHLETELRRWLGRGRLPCRVDVGIGEPEEAIAARVKAYEADLVVLGRHPRRALADRLHSGTLRRLLRRIGQPVLIAANRSQCPYRRVLVPVDLSDSAPAAVLFTADLLPQANLHLLHVYRTCLMDYAAMLAAAMSPAKAGNGAALTALLAAESARRLIAALPPGRPRPTLTVENGDALHVIRKELARQKTDLLVIGNGARSDPGRARIARAAEAAIRSSPCDILFLPLPAAS
jgi:nucleotide-binding universal stress UspA family protein